jgi:hypothetical protein
MPRLDINKNFVLLQVASSCLLPQFKCKLSSRHYGLIFSSRHISYSQLFMQVFNHLLQTGEKQAVVHYCYQPKIMSHLVQWVHIPPVSDFLLRLLLLSPIFELPEKLSLWMSLEVGEVLLGKEN